MTLQEEFECRFNEKLDMSKDGNNYIDFYTFWAWEGYKSATERAAKICDEINTACCSDDVAYLAAKKIRGEE